MSDEFPGALLIQFAKAPQLGQVKTRMQPQLSVEQSLALHCDLVRRTHQTIHRAALCQSQLWISGEDSAGFFQSLQPLPTIKHQRGADLGQRMHSAIATGLGHWQSVLLIGSDCPAINRNYLRQCLLALETVDVVLGPAEDGGYVLIAMKTAAPGVFDGVSWSSPQVLAQTRARLAALQLSYFELPVLNDIDRPEDLVHLEGLPGQKKTSE
ncbi:MAG: TIGR04282 family arsenosugar biosynthesis glycosyltransferase [Gammaproteobacteria bacterium]|nr:TIGR04282 family arsenosugar biosynthesis glycosyltransferase [Gammaproteobacteria bacterium]MBQ0838997.1 TIGR04282 family arsenosugar biosynthesis glycosyltransferase [Gammaproteobacteria bacterium]